MKEITASEFKAKCLAILDKVAEQGEPITILKRGKSVVLVIPPTPRPHQFPQESLAGTVSILGNIISPSMSSSEWESESNIPQ